MSQLHAELTAEAAELGFESIDEAEANGYKVDYGRNGWHIKPDVNKAYKDLEEKILFDRNSKKIEMVHKALSDAKELIALAYKPDDKKFCNPSKDIDDEVIKDYFYTLNDMCIELTERNAMQWQKEDDENKG